MKRNFTFSKFRIINPKVNLNFIDTFCTKDKKDKQKNNLLLKNKIKIIPVLKIDKSKYESINNKNKITSENIDNNYNPDMFNRFSSPIKNQKLNNIKNDINNVMINSKKSDKFFSPNKKKIKFPIPINKTQIKPYHNLNQNYVININNNINNSYQIKMQNNLEINKDTNNINNYEFEKMKVYKSEEGIKNYNSLNQKTSLIELSDLSCFKSNKKLFNLNSIGSFVNNDNDLLSYSDDTNFGNNLKNNSKPEKQNNNNIYNNNGNKKKKIYINPVDFQKFCQEIEEKLNF